MSQYTDYVVHSDPLRSDENSGCCICGKEGIPSCAVCNVCRECHPKQAYWHMHQLLASWYCEAMFRSDNLLHSLDDGELQAFFNSLEDEKRDDLVARSILAKIGYRRMAHRAEELGCDVYCGEHDCDTRNCPSGSHGDD